MRFFNNALVALLSVSIPATNAVNPRFRIRNLQSCGDGDRCTVFEYGPGDPEADFSWSYAEQSGFSLRGTFTNWGVVGSTLEIVDPSSGDSLEMEVTEFDDTSEIFSHKAVATGPTSSTLYPEASPGNCNEHTIEFHFYGASNGIGGFIQQGAQIDECVFLYEVGCSCATLSPTPTPSSGPSATVTDVLMDDGADETDDNNDDEEGDDDEEDELEEDCEDCEKMSLLSKLGLFPSF